MTLIQVINPNTTRAMTSAIGSSARAVAAAGVTVSAVSPETGPEAIESHYDAALAVPGVLASVVTTLSRTIGHAWDLVDRYGFGRACQGVHACDVPALALDSPASRALIGKQCVRARDGDGCDAIVLGCAGMSGMAGELAAGLGIPVVDGVTAAVKIVESLVALGLRTSARDEYGPPPVRNGP